MTHQTAALTRVVTPGGGPNLPPVPVKTTNAFNRFWIKVGTGIKDVSIKAGKGIAKASKVFWGFLKSPGGVAITLFAAGSAILGSAWAPKLKGGKQEAIAGVPPLSVPNPDKPGEMMDVAVTKSVQSKRNKITQIIMIIAGSLLMAAGAALAILSGINKNQWVKA